MKLCCGIDLGLRPKTSMVIMGFNGKKFELKSEVLKGIPDEQIEGLIWKYRPEVTAIDAPLSASMEKVRPAEPELRKRVRKFTRVITASSIGSPFGRMLFPITDYPEY